jgi:hypothetical protein
MVNAFLHVMVTEVDTKPWVPGFLHLRLTC